MTLDLSCLARFEVVGHAFQHRAERAALLAGRDHGAIDIVELARRGGQRAREGVAGVDLAAQVRHQLALARLFAVFHQRGQRAFERQAGADQAGHLPRPDRQAGAVEDAALEARGHFIVGRLHDHRDFERHQRLRAQLRARRLGVVGLDQAGLGFAVGVEGFEFVGGHLRAYSRVTRMTSSGDVTPSTTSRSPSSRIGFRPAFSAATKSWLSAARLWISARTLSSAVINS